MSADNWAICPRCANATETEIAEAKQMLDENYGKVSRERYLQLLDKSREKPRYKATLREDYEIGIDVNEFYVDYSASCSECGFTHKFERRERVDHDHEN